MKRVRICVGGQVQGVGFRPFVYRLATALNVGGQVANTPEGVVIEAQGTREAVDEFVRRLQSDLPPLARIAAFALQEERPRETEAGFRIELSSGDSSGHSGHSVLISPDVAVCPDCLQEFFDPHNRRYLYPFINCTNCGPRFTITRSIPYDRATTSMACFPLCPDCAGEYADPADRRFHAQPNACPLCGPQLWIADPHAAPHAADTTLEHAAFRNAEALRVAAEALVDGKIVAVRGLGGFHLACDAHNSEALATLRRRKNRPHKSLAVMVPDLEAVRRIAVLTDAEAALLTSPACPIVILPRLNEALPDLIAPDIDSVGVMLPSTPLHHALLHAVRTIAARAGGDPQASERAIALVMTSGNPRGEPLSLGNREALTALADFADLFLLHNRDILVRADDSVLRVLDTNPDSAPQPLMYRRARGYTPSPLPLFGKNAKLALPTKSILGLGGHLKANLCCTRGADAFVSQHVGDLENPAVTAFYTSACDHLLHLLEVEPQEIVCDLHPDYYSTQFARALAARRGLPLRQVQHHVAHHHAVLGEHGHHGPALGLMLDGTGFGPDRTIWGGELLLSVPGEETRRIGRLSPFALPGNERAIREPWRLAVGLFPDGAPLPAHLALPQAEAVRELAHSTACLRTSSCGRLFDAVAALLAVCTHISYEGQAAIRLEHAQDFAARSEFTVPLLERDLLELDSAALFGHLAKLQPSTSPGVLARVFHLALMDGLCRLVRVAADRHRLTTVALGGGVFQNATLARELPPRLRRVGLTPLLPVQLPPGDGSLSYGQVVWASQQA